MNHSQTDWIAQAESVSKGVLAKHADDVDRHGRWPSESLEALARSGLMGLTVHPEFGGAGQGPRVFSSVLQAMAEHCASTAMIYLMHLCGTQVIASADDFTGRKQVLSEIAAGRHLSTLAFSETGSRSHFWAPVSRAVADGPIARISAKKSWVTSAGRAESYVVSAQSPVEHVEGSIATTLYFVPGDAPGLSCNGTWDGLGLRGNGSGPMLLENVPVSPSDRLSPEGGGFQVMLETVLPWFQLGNASVSLGVARAATESTRQHLLRSRLEHLDQSLAMLMNLRARLAQMQITIDTQSAFLAQVANRIENPGPETMLAVLECKASAAEAALQVTDLALRVCGGAGFSKHLTVERNFRDAQAGRVMAPTSDVLHDFIGKSLLGIPLF